MRIVHGSDWHGSIQECPPADLYVFTGDMLDNFPIMDWKNGRMLDWPKIVPEHERKAQAEAIRKFTAGGGMRQYLGSPDAPVVVVRGNHDFVELAPMFKGCNLVHEFVNNELIDVAGVKITGHRGIPYIYGGWNDEERRDVLKDRFRAMPHADLYLTHYPLAGVLDNSEGPGHILPPGQSSYGDGVSYGLEGGLVDLLMYRMTRAAHLFGHIHECGGSIVKHGNVTFSNAATTVNVIDF